MKNTFGNSISVTIFGESHGYCIGAVLDGLPAGLEIDRDYIGSQLEKRRPFGKISTSRAERDEFQIVSGCFNGKTCGTPLTIIIPNETPVREITTTAGRDRGMPITRRISATQATRTTAAEDISAGG